MLSDRSLQRVKDTYPYLWPFLFSPGFLEIATSTHDFKCGYQLKTMTGLILKKLLQRVNDPLIGQKYVSVVDRVKKLTYVNLKQRQWFTREKDLVEHNLTESDVVTTEIMSGIEGPNRTLDYYCRFEQEFYAGCYALHMEKDEFLEFATEVATKDHFLISTAVACGLLFDDVVRRKVRALGAAPQRHLDYKRNLMAEFFKRECNSKNDPARIIDLITVLFEGQRAMKSIIRKNIFVVKADGHIAPLCRMKAISYVVQQCSIIDKLSFVQCGLNDRKVEVLYDHVIDSQVKFASLDVSYNGSITPECMYLLAKCMIRCKCRIFRAIDCQLTPLHIRRFAAGIGDGKFDSLHLSENKDLGAEGMFYLGKLVGDALVISFSVVNCGLGDEEWKQFAEGMGKAEVATGPKVRVTATWMGSS